VYLTKKYSRSFQTWHKQDDGSFIYVPVGHKVVARYMGFMQRIGVDIDKYRSREYGRTQEIADAALFLGFSALVVPSARWECPNLVVFTEKSEPGQLTLVGSPNLVDWEEWREQLRRVTRARSEGAG